MRFLTKSSTELTKIMLDKNKLEEVYILPLNENFIELVKEFIESNTGFMNNPVMGFTKIFGEVKLDDAWELFIELVPVVEGDFILEFEVPDDMVVKTGLDDYNKIANRLNPDLEELERKFVLGDEEIDSDNEVGFSPFISADHLVGFYRVSADWDSEEVDYTVGGTSKLMETLSFFR